MATGPFGDYLGAELTLKQIVHTTAVSISFNSLVCRSQLRLWFFFSCLLTARLIACIKIEYMR